MRTRNITIAFMLYAAAAVLAQPSVVSAADSTPSPAVSAPAATQPGPRVVKTKANGDHLALGQSATVELAGLDEWRKSNGGVGLVLYLDGHPVSRNARAGPSANEVIFDLEWLPESEKHWAAIVGRPQFDPRSVRVQVGPVEQTPFPGSVLLPLETVSLKLFTMFAAAIAILLAGFWMVARTSDLLRDGPIAPAVGRRPYSLGRVQMAVWFFVVIAAFLFIWIVTGTYQPLTPSVLALIGISAGTALVAAMIDANKQGVIDNQSKSLDTERLRLETEVASLQTAIAETKARVATAAPSVDTNTLQDSVTRNQADVALKQARTSQIRDQLIAVGTQVMPRTSAGFWKDILSDENGVGFHRFQIAVWTVVLALIFGFVVYNTLGMPNFPAELLALMGISSGTYLGFKLPETN